MFRRLRLARFRISSLNAINVFEHIAVLFVRVTKPSVCRSSRTRITFALPLHGTLLALRARARLVLTADAVIAAFLAWQCSSGVSLRVLDQVMQKAASHARGCTPIDMTTLIGEWFHDE